MEGASFNDHNHVGRDDLEYSSEEDMKMVSLTPTAILPGTEGYNSHSQLRDCFALSSIDPNYAYLSTNGIGKRGVCCINLVTGEHTQVGEKWGIHRNVHCIATGFGYLAVTTSYNIIVALEHDWSQVWRKEAVSGMINGCVFTKLLAGEEDASPEEPILLVASNGGTLYTFELPKAASITQEGGTESQKLTDIVEQNGRTEQSEFASDFFGDVQQPSMGTLTMKQCLTRRDPTSTALPLPNLNSLAPGKGIYTDYLVVAPDHEHRLLIFLRDYNQSACGQHDIQSVFQLIEHQAHSLESIVLPLSPKADVTKEDSTFVNWAPWHNRSILAASTESNYLTVYNFDGAQALLADNPPGHVFDFEESKSTVLFQHKCYSKVRLMKFSPLPSIPILAFADSNNRMCFLECGGSWSIERVKLPGDVTGMFWALDASKLFVATTKGLITIAIKLLPSLVDTLLSKIANGTADSTTILEGGDEELAERLALLTVGRCFDRSVSWPRT